MRPEVLTYYRRMGEEMRLAAGIGRLEFLRTWDVLTRILPPAPASVLDVGGATGVYAGPLAAAGYDVHVVDPVPEQVAVAAARPGVTASVGDARSLVAADASVDAVLMLGPLYHLTERADRIAAWREAARVVRPGGLVVAAAISRYASLTDGYGRGFFAVPGYASLVASVLETGRHEPSTDQPWFTTAYFHHPDELAEEPVVAGLTLDRVLAVEGLVSSIERIADVLGDEATTGLLLDQLRLLEEEPTLLGSSDHLLAVARRPGPPVVPSAKLRPMTAADADQVLAIYQAGIDTGNATFQTAVPTWADWDAGHLPQHRYVAVAPAVTGAADPAVTGAAAPALGAVVGPAGDELLGWVAASAVSSRPVYAGVVEHSVYVHPDAQGRGVGRALLRALIDSTEAAGIWTLTTAIFPENTASVALHRTSGFRVVGRRERVGRHHGVWRDVTLMERRSSAVR